MPREERVWNTVPENGVRSCVHFCLRLLLRLERWEIVYCIANLYMLCKKRSNSCGNVGQLYGYDYAVMTDHVEDRKTILFVFITSSPQEPHLWFLTDFHSTGISLKSGLVLKMLDRIRGSKYALNMLLLYCEQLIFAALPDSREASLNTTFWIEMFPLTIH